MKSTKQSITIFTIPKPFIGHTGIIQYNAIKSWTTLRPRPQILLFGEEEGVKDACSSLEVTHVPEIQVNEFGTPLLDGVFRRASEFAHYSSLMYINADIILLEDFFKGLEILKLNDFRRFLLIGQRVDVDVKERLNFDDSSWSSNLRKMVLEKGKLASVFCKDYFVFPKGLYYSIPPFAVGRGSWDNWMVYYAHKSKIPVIDLTSVVTVIHQNHDYRHFSGGTRGQAYWFGDEAKRNAQIASGAHLVKGTESNWKMTQSGIKRKLFPLLNILYDMPQLLKLLKQIYLG